MLRAALVLLLFLWASMAHAEKRVALVIGNSSYRNVPRLPNPKNDAEAIADLFRKAAFDVVDDQADLGADAMRRTLRDFSQQARDADIAAVFYAGHGMEMNGVNYLIPVDASLARDIDVEDEAVTLDRVIRTIEPARRLQLVILDSCRDNPFLGSMQRTVISRSLRSGLGDIDERGLPPNTLIAYAQQAGLTADDGMEANSPYTAALLKHLFTPGLDVELALRRVRDEVLKATHNRQRPFKYGSLGGTEIVLMPTEVPRQVAPAAQRPLVDYDKEMEIAFWNAVKDSNDAEILGTYLERFPSGTFAALARVLIDRIGQESAARGALAAREEDLKRAEAAKAAAEAKRMEEQRKLDERGRQEELARAVDEAEAAKQAARRAEEERQALLKVADETRKTAAAAKAAQETAAAREEELRASEKAKKEADAKHADEQRRIKESKLQDELKKAKEDARKAQDAASRAELERLAALNAAEEAHRAAASAKIAAEQSQREEEAKKLPERRADERRRLQESGRAAENNEAHEEARRAEEALKVAESERLAALKAAEEARKAAEKAKAEQELAVLQAQKEPAKVAGLPTSIETAAPQTSSSPALIRAIQTELKRIGCYPGSVDGNWGAKAKDALREFGKLAKVDLAFDEPSDTILNALAIRKGRVCSLPQSIGDFDGAWTITRVGEGQCGRGRVYSFPVTIRNGQVIGERAGTISASGAFRYTGRGLDGSPTHFSGVFQGSSGHGTFRHPKCAGTFTARRR